MRWYLLKNGSIVSFRSYKFKIQSTQYKEVYIQLYSVQCSLITSPDTLCNRIKRSSCCMNSARFVRSSCIQFTRQLNTLISGTPRFSCSRILMKEIPRIFRKSGIVKIILKCAHNNDNAFVLICSASTLILHLSTSKRYFNHVSIVKFSSRNSKHFFVSEMILQQDAADKMSSIFSSVSVIYPM